MKHMQHYQIKFYVVLITGQVAGTMQGVPCSLPAVLLCPYPGKMHSLALGRGYDCAHSSRVRTRTVPYVSYGTRSGRHGNLVRVPYG